MRIKSVERIETDWMASLSGAAKTKNRRGSVAMKLGGGVSDNRVELGSSLKALINVEPRQKA